MAKIIRIDSVRSYLVDPNLHDKLASIIRTSWSQFKHFSNPFVQPLEIHI